MNITYNKSTRRCMVVCDRDNFDQISKLVLDATNASDMVDGPLVAITVGLEHEMSVKPPASLVERLQFVGCLITAIATGVLAFIGAITIANSLR